MKGRPRSGRSRALYWAFSLMLTFPAAAQAQTGVIVLGTLTDADTDAAVEGALVRLGGWGSTMSTPEGTFRFRGVQPGDYVLSVEAFGYEDLEVDLAVATDTTLALTLGAAPVPIDGILVEAGTLDYEGRVVDPLRDFTVIDAQVIVGDREPVWTDDHGRFDLENVPEGVPLHLTIRAFGYLPVDTTLVPDDEARHEFHLARDAFAEAMIGMQVRRLERRAGGRLMTGWASMDREDILRFTGAHTARTMLEFELPEHVRERISCVIVDERQADANRLTGREMSEFVLDHTLPEEIERVELLVFDAVPGRPIMLRVYTRYFIQAMTTQDIPLRPPTMTPTGECL